MLATEIRDIYIKTDGPLVFTPTEARQGIVLLAIGLAPRLTSEARSQLLAEVTAALTLTERIAKNEVQDLGEPSRPSGEA